MSILTRLNLLYSSLIINCWWWKDEEIANEKSEENQKKYHERAHKPEEVLESLFSFSSLLYFSSYLVMGIKVFLKLVG